MKKIKKKKASCVAWAAIGPTGIAPMFIRVTKKNLVSVFRLFGRNYKQYGYRVAKVRVEEI